jgi:hypothetical protein
VLSSQDIVEELKQMRDENRSECQITKNWDSINLEYFVMHRISERITAVDPWITNGAS